LSSRGPPKDTQGLDVSRHDKRRRTAASIIPVAVMVPLLWSLLPLMMLLNEIGAEGFVILIVAGVLETTTPTRPSVVISHVVVVVVLM
jgi:hypothetical protein